MPAQRGGGICEIMGDGCIKFCRARRGGFARLGVSTLPLALHAGHAIGIGIAISIGIAGTGDTPRAEKAGGQAAAGGFFPISRFEREN